MRAHPQVRETARPLSRTAAYFRQLDFFPHRYQESVALNLLELQVRE